MPNTPFKTKDKQKITRMTAMYAQILGVMMNSGKPMLQSIIWLNENFEDTYARADTDVQVFEQIFDENNIEYTINKEKKDKDV